MHTCRVLKKPPFLKLIYLPLQWMICMSIAHALKGPSLKFFINQLDARKVQLVLLRRILIVFSCFYKHGPTRLRLQLELHIEFLSLTHVWSLDYRGEQYLSIFPTESIRTGLNRESVKARKSVHLSPSIDLGASYPNIGLLRWSSLEVHNCVGISCFADNLEVWEIKNIEAFLCMCFPSHSRFQRSKVLLLDIAHQNMTEGELWSALYTSFGRSDPQIRRFCLFTLPESENLHSSALI